jgi:hypothetical protein
MLIVELVTGEMLSTENANHVTKPVKPVPNQIMTAVSPVSSVDSSTKENVKHPAQTTTTQMNKPEPVNLVNNHVKNVPKKTTVSVPTVSTVTTSMKVSVTPTVLKDSG